MKCPKCTNLESKVLESRDLDEGTIFRRRRECHKCGFRFTTYERIEPQTLIVVKKDGSKEEFDSEKIFKGIKKACGKKSIDDVVLKDLIYKIEEDLRKKYKDEVNSKEIGKAVLRHLKDLDRIAYLRFASIYKEFKNIRSFQQELNRILG